MDITLVLTRKPNALFEYAISKKTALHGRFGTLVVLSGGKVSKVKISGASGGIEVPTGVLEVTATGGVQEVKRFTTIERMDGYIQLHPQPDKAYPITYETGNSAVAHLRKDGRCFRVHGGRTAQERGILIHEAPHVGWLIGCIGPRKLDDHGTYTESSRGAMEELFAAVGARAALVVREL
jgi:hypothetical protein